MNYTVQFTEEEFDQLVGDLYCYFRDLKFTLDHRLELNDLDAEVKEYLTNQLDRVYQLQSKLEIIQNRADESNCLYIYILKEVEVNE